MPIYEYKCSKCGNISQAWQKFSDSPLNTCELCGGPVRKIISQNTFRLKGSGWYVTDYTSKSSAHKPAKTEQKQKTTKNDSKKDSTKVADKGE